MSQVLRDHILPLKASAPARLLVLSAALLSAAAGPVAAASGPLPRLAVSVVASQVGADALRAFSGCAAAGCLAVAPPVELGADVGAGRAAWAQFSAALPAGTEVLLHLRVPGHARSASPKADEAALDAAIEGLIDSLPLVNPRVRGVLIEVLSPRGDPDLLQLGVAMLSVRVKAIRPALELAVVFPAGALMGLGERARRIGAYADFVGVTFWSGWLEEARWAASNLQRPVVVLMPAAESLDAAALSSTYLDLVLEQGRDLSVETVWITGGSTPAIAGLCLSFSFLVRSIPSSFVPAQVAASSASLEAETGPAIEVRRFVAGQSADVILVARVDGTPAVPRILVVSHAQPGFQVSCYDASNGHELPVIGSTASAGGTSARCRSEGRYVLVVLHQKAADRVFESVSVAGRAELRVEEVLARWQQYREDQRRALRHYTSTSLLSLHFEQAGLGSGFDVSVRLREFNTGAVREWVQDEFYVNGIRFANRRGFPLPQLEPEKVVTQPLELSLDERYRYALDGIETVDGTTCYVVRFEPTREDEALYTGRVWIDGVTFRHVRLELQQRGGRSNVVSHVERQDFQLFTAGDRQFNLFSAIAVQQVLNVAGRSLLLEKRYRFSDYRINEESFEADAAAARESDRPMFRDTAEGLRKLKKEAGGRAVETTNESRMRSLLVGAFYEGTYDVPIPMAGLSFVDFNYRSTGRQVSLFFAGPILALNVSKQRSRQLRLGVEAALSALPQNNRRYSGDSEVPGESVWVFEETMGGLASWQATPNWSLTGYSHLALNLFRATADTAPDFQVPSNGGTWYLTGESKITKGGYAVTATLMSGVRFGWSEATGIGGTEPLSPSYLKYYVEAAKQFYIRSFTKASLTASYYDGRDLDRFSRYQPSFLSRPRIRGIPGGADTFDAVGVVGASYGFDVMEFVKFEGIYNHAWGRNTSESNRFRNYDGIEFDVSTAAPWGTFLQATAALAARGNTERYNSRWGFYLLVFKPL
jgi:hypothetical protein